jgi:thiosulfate/3-mercaptopyruvate sulfurtransferase
MIKTFILLLISLQLFATQKAFVTTSELAELLENDQVVLLDASTRDSYKISHILHSRHIDVKKLIKTLDSGALRIADTQTVQSYLQTIGVDKTTPIVIYARNTQEELLNSSYVAFVLLYYGFENVSLLDGGYMQWVFENELLVSSLLSEDYEENKSLILNKPKDFAVDTEYIYEHLESVTLLDTREPDIYYGVKKLPEIKSFGHIPHAMSSYFQYNFLHDSMLRSMDELEAIYSKGHKLKDEEIIVYGTSLFDASMTWYILYSHLGYKNVKLYEDSFKEWGNNLDLETNRFIFEGK